MKPNNFKTSDMQILVHNPSFQKLVETIMIVSLNLQVIFLLGKKKYTYKLFFFMHKRISYWYISLAWPIGILKVKSQRTDWDLVHFVGCVVLYVLQYALTHFYGRKLIGLLHSVSDIRG